MYHPPPPTAGASASFDNLSHRAVPRPKERVTLVGPTFTRYVQLSCQGLERSLYMVFFHLLFAAVSLALPGFDTNDDFTHASLFITVQVGVAALLPVALVGAMYFAVPLALKYKACKAAGNFEPANALRDSWAPPEVRRWTAHVLVVVASVLGSYIRRVGAEVRVIDPFHAGVLGALARAMFAGYRRVTVGEGWWEENAHSPSDISKWWGIPQYPLPESYGVPV